jgi:hypothetical protein
MCWMRSAHHENGFSQDGLGFMQPPTEWDGGVGFVSKGMIEANCPPPADDIQVTCAASPPTTLMCMSNCFPFCNGRKTQCYCSQFLHNGRLFSSIHQFITGDGGRSPPDLLMIWCHKQVTKHYAYHLL